MKALLYLIIGTLLASLALNIWFLVIRKPEVVERTITIEKKDTVVDVVRTYDTVYFNRHETRYDTIHRNDTVYVRDEPNSYRDTTADYTLDINAVKLNWYKLDIHARDTIQMVRTIESTVMQKPKRFGVGVFAGPTYDMVNRSWGASVGIGITFDLTR